MFRHRQPVEARRTGDALVATFHKSDAPLIWHFDLARNHSFVLELHDKDHGCKLGITSAEGIFHAIAGFPSRAEAEKAFAILEKVIARGKTTWFTPIAKMLAIICTIFLVLVITYGIAVAFQLLKTWPAPATTESSSANFPSAGRAALKNGVPEPADQFLRPPP